MYGQLGIGSYEQQTKPVQVEGLSDIIDLDAGTNHSLALKADGTVWAWGDNAYGQLGSGDRQSSAKPIQIKGLNNVYRLSAAIVPQTVIDEIAKHL